MKIFKYLEPFGNATHSEGYFSRSIFGAKKENTKCERSPPENPLDSFTLSCERRVKEVKESTDFMDYFGDFNRFLAYFGKIGEFAVTSLNLSSHKNVKEVKGDSTFFTLLSHYVSTPLDTPFFHIIWKIGGVAIVRVGNPDFCEKRGYPYEQREYLNTFCRQRYELFTEET